MEMKRIDIKNGNRECRKSAIGILTSLCNTISSRQIISRRSPVRTGYNTSRAGPKVKS